jgi:hypothetical protein
MWFFYSACQGPNQICGASFILHFSYLHMIKGKAILGLGTNNFEEFKALFALLKVAMDKDVLDSHI